MTVIKKNEIKIIGFLILCILIILPFSSLAQSASIKMPMGGKVKKTGKTATLVCAAMYGPTFVIPYNGAPPGPYFIRAGTRGPKVDKYILGMYNPIPDMSTCYNPESGAPIPAFELKPYGVSRN